MSQPLDPDFGQMSDDDDDMLDAGLPEIDAPAVKTKPKAPARKKQEPKTASAWAKTGNAELDALFAPSTLTVRSLNTASRPSMTGAASAKPPRGGADTSTVPISKAEKLLAKLAQQKEEDDKESKKLNRLQKHVEDDARAEAAAARRCCEGTTRRGVSRRLPSTGRRLPELERRRAAVVAAGARLPIGCAG